MRRKNKRILITLLIVSGLLIGGTLWGYSYWKYENTPPLELISKSPTYHTLLESGMTPARSPKYNFPTNFQYLNGCFGYAVGHILMERGHTDIDFLDMEQRIEKPREVLWGAEEKKRLAQEYGLEFTWSKSAERLLELLALGESVVLTYKYPLDDGDWVLHAVAAYSFDEKGIWVSDSLSGKNIRIPHNEVFTEEGDKLLYWFAQVKEKEI